METSGRAGVPVRHIALLILVPLALLQAAATYVWVDRARDDLARAAAEPLRLGSTLLAERPADEVGTEVLLAFGRQVGAVRAWRVGADGRILASSLASEVGKPLESSWGTLLREAAGPERTQTVRWGERLLLAVVHRLEPEGAWLVVLGDAGALRAAQRRATLAALGLSLAAWLFVCGLVASVLTMKVARPLERLRERGRQLVERGPLSEATLDRLRAETPRVARPVVDAFADLARAHGEAHEALRQAHVRHLAVVDLASDLVFVASFDGVLLEANQVFYETLGLTPSPGEVLRLQTLASSLPLPVLLPMAYRSRTEQSRVQDVDLMFVRRDGREVYVDVTVQAIIYGGGPAFVVAARDRTEVRALRDELKAHADAEALQAGVSGDAAGEEVYAEAVLLEDAETPALSNEPVVMEETNMLSPEQPTTPPAETPTGPPGETPTGPPDETRTAPPQELPTTRPGDQPTEPPGEPPGEPDVLPPDEEPTIPPDEEPTEPPGETPPVPPEEVPGEDPTAPPGEEPTAPPEEEPTEPEPPGGEGAFGGRP